MAGDMISTLLVDFCNGIVHIFVYFTDRAGCDEPATPEPILMTAGDLTTSERRPDNHR